ncbi:hypothetical protein NVP1121O_013 [Vibrio phage 1.121.O._10N.286.46.C4]|nr:hypothetical protein NVP1121O_013 [Vibrio phage 1.121.O._10N.286.46.C4]
MFDANARNLPDGKLFFVECHSVDTGSYTLNKLLVVGKNYLCEKLGDDPRDCRFLIYLNSTKKDYISLGVNFEDEENFDHKSWFVYSGLPDGTEFISEEWKQKALTFLGGEWYE